MSAELPEGIVPEGEIAITWVRDDLSTKVTATLGEATITVETTEDSAHVVPWLVGALPTILEAAWAQIEAQNDDPQEDK